MRNWAGNVTFAASQLHRPTSVEELQKLVAGSPRIRALGTAHSFNRIADTDGDLERRRPRHPRRSSTPQPAR